MSDSAPCGHRWVEPDEDVAEGDAHYYNPTRQPCACGAYRDDAVAMSTGTPVYLKRGMPGTYEGQAALLHIAHPVSGVARPGLVWLECEVVWSHGTAEGFWASPGEYVEVL